MLRIFRQELRTSGKKHFQKSLTYEHLLGR